jgi:acyl carrier protein
MNKQKLRGCFSESLGIPIERVTDDLAYSTFKEWDSIGHMALVASIETAFDIVLEIDDIIAMSTVAKAEEILGRYGVSFDAA